jgi:hypothetical protein
VTNVVRKREARIIMMAIEGASEEPHVGGLARSRRAPTIRYLAALRSGPPSAADTASARDRGLRLHVTVSRADRKKSVLSRSVVAGLPVNVDGGRALAETAASPAQRAGLVVDESEACRDGGRDRTSARGARRLRAAPAATGRTPEEATSPKGLLPRSRRRRPHRAGAAEGASVSSRGCGGSRASRRRDHIEPSENRDSLDGCLAVVGPPLKRPPRPPHLSRVHETVSRMKRKIPCFRTWRRRERRARTVQPGSVRRDGNS